MPNKSSNASTPVGGGGGGGGATGPTGPTGPIGATGPVGATGATGAAWVLTDPLVLASTLGVATINAAGGDAILVEATGVDKNFTGKASGANSVAGLDGKTKSALYVDGVEKLRVEPSGTTTAGPVTSDGVVVTAGNTITFPNMQSLEPGGVALPAVVTPSSLAAACGYTMSNGVAAPVDVAIGEITVASATAEGGTIYKIATANNSGASISITGLRVFIQGTVAASGVNYWSIRVYTYGGGSPVAIGSPFTTIAGWSPPNDDAQSVTATWPAGTVFLVAFEYTGAPAALGSCRTLFFG